MKIISHPGKRISELIEANYSWRYVYFKYRNNAITPRAVCHKNKRIALVIYTGFINETHEKELL